MSFQSMMDGNSGYSQPTGYSNPTPQRSNPYAGGSSSNPWAAQHHEAPGSPAYGTEFAHSHTHDADPFVAASSQVAIDIESISLNYREIRDALTDINTPRDTADFRASLRKKIEDSNALGKRIQSAIRQLGSIQTGSVQERRTNKAKVEKMDASFTTFFSTQYGQCVKQVEEQMKRYTPRSAHSAVAPMGMGQGSTGQYYAGQRDEEEEHASLLEAARQQEYAQLSNDVESQHAMIQHRDQAIRSLQRDMGEVHDMFKDLANLVSEQGHMVDDIESNVNQASNDVDTGAAEVNEAHRQQKKSRNKLCIIAIIITVLVAIAVLITVVVMMTKK